MNESEKGREARYAKVRELASKLERRMMRPNQQSPAALVGAMILCWQLIALCGTLAGLLIGYELGGGLDAGAKEVGRTEAPDRWGQ